MSSLCRTLPNVSAPTYTSILIKRSTSHAGVVRHSFPLGLMQRRDFEQWTLDGTWSRTGPPLSSVFLAKPTYKIWPSWAWLTLPLNSCRKWVTAQSTNQGGGHAEGGGSYESEAVWRRTILPGELNGFGPYGQYSHYRLKSIALLCHINAGRVGSWQGMGGLSNAGCASVGANPRSCHLWGDGLHRWGNGWTGFPWLSAISENALTLQGN